jgi:hypothetical protein
VGGEEVKLILLQVQASAKQLLVYEDIAEDLKNLVGCKKTILHISS